MCEVVTDGPTQTQEIGREEKRELFPSENTFDTVFGPVQHVMVEGADCLCNGSLNYLSPYPMRQYIGLYTNETWHFLTKAINCSHQITTKSNC